MSDVLCPQKRAVMLVLGFGLGLKPNFVALALALEFSPLAKNSRPKSWRATMFTMNFHRLEWIIFQDPHTLLTYRADTGDSTHLYVSCQWWVLSDVIKLCLYPCKSTRKNRISLLHFSSYENILHWDGHGLGLGLGLGLECSGLVNITGIEREKR